MGVSIHYSGRFKKDQSLIQFNTELADIAESMGWESQQLEDDDFPEEGSPIEHGKLYGILINIKQCETVAFTFLSDRKLAPPMHFELLELGKKAEYTVISIDKGITVEKTIHDDFDFEKKPIISVKTQFASFEVHIQIIKLIRYLSEKYFDDFELIDETEYWEKGNEDDSRKKFEGLLHLINAFRSNLTQLTIRKDETIENAIIRAIRNTRRKLIQKKKDTDQ